MKRLDHVIGITVASMSAITSSALVVWIVRTDTSPGDVVWPWLLVASLSAMSGWIAVWAWAHERWSVAAPALFGAAIGTFVLSYLAVIPVGFGGLALSRAIRAARRRPAHIST